jgi:hypothetical protein
MKKIFITAFITVLLVTGLATAGNAQRFYINVRPAMPAVVRPAYRPAGSVWIGGDYVWDGARAGYVWHPGYWARPPRPRAIWITGRWVRERRGYYWVPGHWRY